MKKILLYIVICALWCTLPQKALSEPRDGPERPDAKSSEQDNEQLNQAENLDPATLQYLHTRKLRRTGAVLLGTGVGVIVIGAALVEIDAFGNIGMVGFTCLGAGIGTSVAGMFLLGFSKTSHPRTKQYALSPVPLSRGKGMGLVYSQKF